jgi:hypothetical protein
MPMSRGAAWKSLQAGAASGVGLLGLVAALGSPVSGCARVPPSTPDTHPSGLAARSRTLLPVRVRRLTNAEYEQTVSELLGVREPVAAKLPPDVRQEGYTANAAQIVPSSWAVRLEAVARDIAHRAVADHLHDLAPCAGKPGCEASFVQAFGRRAWRRPLEPSEMESLRSVFDGAASSGGFALGAETVLSALLQSPSLLYLTELGPDGAKTADTVTLTAYETAALLSYTVRGGPPDEPLLQAAASGALASPDERERQARRLLSLSDTRFHFRRFVLEWLEVDGLEATTKDTSAFPTYDELKDHMLGETAAYSDEVMVFAGGSLRALLDARFASVDPPMARFYGMKTWGARASLASTRRAGVLQQASFLAAHAHEDVTSPVKRGDFVLRRVLCVRLPRPAEVGIDTVFPPPSSAKTTRERFGTHADDPACRGCHDRIDPLGFTFERFDAAGSARTTENGKPVDASARATIAGRELSFADSLELSEWLSRDPEAEDCYLRQAFRYFTAQHDPSVEDALLALGRSLPPDRRGNLFEALIAFVRSDLFVERKALP